MIDMGTVTGSAAQAKPIIIGKDTVYVHTDITPLKKEDENGKAIENQFTYNEVQYTKDEYIAMMVEQNSKAESDITDLQLALVEMYSVMEGSVE